MQTKYSLALDFHENTKSLIISDNFDPKPHYKIYPNTKTIPLNPNYAPITPNTNSDFLSTLLSRKSTRAFSQDSISLENLSNLLTLSFGVRNNEEHPTSRTYPSAGGRFPIEVYVAVLRSDDMEKGIYHYNVKDNTIEFLKPGNYSDELQNFYKNQEEIIPTGYPCLILFSMVFNRTMQKYGERGYRFILLDAGHMGQNLYLVATHLGLGAVALGAGSGNDEQLDNIIGLVSGEENIFYSFAIGVPQ